jgi:hypothetical protein
MASWFYRILLFSYRSLFFALTLIGLLAAKNIFTVLTSNAFQEDLIHPAFLIAFVFLRLI